MIRLASTLIGVVKCCALATSYLRIKWYMVLLNFCLRKWSRFHNPLINKHSLSLFTASTGGFFVARATAAVPHFLAVQFNIYEWFNLTLFQMAIRSQNNCTVWAGKVYSLHHLTQCAWVYRLSLATDEAHLDISRSMNNLSLGVYFDYNSAKHCH